MDVFKKLLKRLGVICKTVEKDQQTSLLALGKLLSNQQKMMVSDNIQDYEFKIFSEYGCDGIIQY